MELGLALLVGVRVLRYRWLRPRLAPRMTVAGLIVTPLGLFAAGVCLVSRSARVLPTLLIAPAVTGCLLLIVELRIFRSWSGPGQGRRTSIRVTSP